MSQDIEKKAEPKRGRRDRDGPVSAYLQRRLRSLDEIAAREDAPQGDDRPPPRDRDQD